MDSADRVLIEMARKQPVTILQLTNISGVGSVKRQRYGNEVRRLFTVLNERLEDRDFICGDYTIADMITWPWTITWKAQEIDLPGKFPNVRAWYNRCKERPGLRRGYEVGRDMRTISKNPPDEKTRRILFSNKRPDMD